MKRRRELVVKSTRGVCCSGRHGARRGDCIKPTVLSVHPGVCPEFVNFVYERSRVSTQRAWTSFSRTTRLLDSCTDETSK